MSTVTDLAPVTMSAEAASQVAEFVKKAGEKEGTGLRLGVVGGGCSGFQYRLALDLPRETDHVFESEGQTILVDPAAMRLVAGSEIFFRDELMTSGFDVRNPNATASCGCGTSFRVDEGAEGCSVA